MADNENTGTPLIPDDMHDWSHDQLMVPSGAKVPEPKTDDTPPADDDEPETPAAVDSDEPEIEYVQDPGDYQPADYSFEVNTYDEDGKHPKSHTIASVDDWDKLMETDPNFGSSAAMTKAMRLASKMEINLEADHKAWQAKKDDYEKVSAEDKQQTDQLATWEKELSYLVERGDLPKVAKKYLTADWSDPEVAKQDGVKEQVALMNFMKKENALRAKAGLQAMTSMLDAFNASKAQAPKDVTTSPPKAGTTVKERQAASARVAGGSSPANAGAPQGIMVGRGGSLDDIGRDWSF